MRAYTQHSIGPAGAYEILSPEISAFAFIVFCRLVSHKTGDAMASFSLPQINDNPDGGWGPSSSNLPSQFKFKDIPYAPYSKSDKLGRFADWNDISGDRPANLGLSAAAGGAGGQTRGGPGGRRRDGQPAFGSGTASAFAYFHAEDESSFSLVDNKAGAARRGGAMPRGRGSGRGGGAYGRGGSATRGGVRGGFSGQRGGGGQRGGRRGWRDWEKVCLHLYESVCPEGHKHITLFWM